ncbi:hypothetical protein BMETH_2438_1 [methanotrophic bacterial endosymbiont of Bathymodiolus sp.]|nr:hypothetical protein BMETH_2438_1 [methanotrophic bacterial endosymbiont of Bathymodiolus sp.]
MTNRLIFSPDPEELMISSSMPSLASSSRYCCAIL